MSQNKALIGLATLLGTLALSAAPASATFNSLNGTTQGKGILKLGTTAAFTISEEKGTPELRCPWAVDQWKIRKQDQKQEGQLKGDHLNIVSQWLQCGITVLLVKFPVEVKGCELQIGQQKLTSSIVRACIVVIRTKPSCTIEMPPQEGLKEIKLSNVQRGMQITSNVTGIKNSYPGKTAENEKNAETCKGQLGEPGKATFKAETIEGQVEVV